MSIKDIFNKVKSIFLSKEKRIEASKDEKYRIECEKEGRSQEYKEYLLYKKNNESDIERFKKLIEEGKEIGRWKYALKDAQKSKEFIRPNYQEDIKERDYWRAHFYEEFLKVIPRDKDLRFHGTSIYNTKSILKSGGIFSSVDINDGYMASTDASGEISASTVATLDRTIQGWFADFGAYIRGLPCGCIFALNPRTENDRELKQFDAMEAVNFKEHPEQLYGIFTSKENISKVKEWLENVGLNPNLVYTFEGFLKKIEQEKNSNFKKSIVVNDEIKEKINEVEKDNSDYIDIEEKVDKTLE